MTVTKCLIGVLALCEDVTVAAARDTDAATIAALSALMSVSVLARRVTGALRRRR
jgi:hypothetical protein